MNFRDSITLSVTSHIFALFMTMVMAARPSHDSAQPLHINIVEERAVVTNSAHSVAKPAETADTNEIRPAEQFVAAQTSSEQAELKPDQPQKPVVEQITQPEQDVEAVRQTSDHDYMMHDGMMLQMHREYVLRQKIAFLTDARFAVDLFLSSVLRDKDFKKYDGLTANVKLSYGPTGDPRQVEILSGSEDLRQLLERISWRALPMPKLYMLRSESLELHISVQDSRPMVSIGLL